MQEVSVPVPPSAVTIGKPPVYATTTEVDVSHSPRPSPDDSSPQLIPHSPSASPSPSHTQPMARLLDQAPEVLHHIFQHVEPVDLARLARTCRHLNRVVKTDELLWKIHYLSLFDPPNDDDSETWRARLSRLINLQKILESDSEEVKTNNLSEILTQTLALTAQTLATSPKNTSFLSKYYQQGLNINTILCCSSLFTRARPRQWPCAPTEELRQISAQLHVLAGMNIDAPWPDPKDNPASISDAEIAEPEATEDTEDTRLRLRDYPTPLRDVHPWARSRVYDLRRYKESNMWGPFLDDGSGRIDWEKVQAIMVVLAYNHRLYTERRGLIGADSLGLSDSIRTLLGDSSVRNVSSTRSNLLRPWEGLFEGIAPDSYVSSPLDGKPKPSLHPDLDALDPYGVTGTWMRIVCFLDYNDLYRFNFDPHGANIPADQERDPISTREAFRLIKLQLQVTRVEDQDGLDEHGKPLLPVVYFEGTSRSTFMAWDPNANSRIRGTVQATAAGAIRWTSFSIFHGEERWRSEGVQIGGLKSARGILGNWFDKDYDAHGPAGPTAFWKISDSMVEEKRRDVPNVLQIFMAE
ncbi:F-box domain cyclin-like protein [Cladophialophora carrionii]|uniref:F-box domain cyclin-like protein n=1 Tax=Cladophialophora carrionii TaxID=86049 RepID=A0A1C1CMT3_9EURO|nr:F-box domain cyclin-like protein [Cladophialophora carrionii]